MKTRIGTFWILIWIMLCSAGCSGITDKNSWYHPALDTTWQWQLSDKLNTSYSVMLYDIDLFDTTGETIQALHRSGRKVICYFSAGSFESWRSDATAFPESVRGKKMDGWDEQWIDIRSDLLIPIMRSRLDLAQDKGCDGVEPDNVDGYTNKTGFDLSSSDQLRYNRFLAHEAHLRHLAIGLKNDLDQIPALSDIFDFAINEQCHEYNECEKNSPFIQAGKPVFNAEYAERYIHNIRKAREKLCAKANQEHFHTLVLPLSLDGSFRYSCDQEDGQ